MKEQRSLQTADRSSFKPRRCQGETLLKPLYLGGDEPDEISQETDSWSWPACAACHDDTCAPPCPGLCLPAESYVGIRR